MLCVLVLLGSALLRLSTPVQAQNTSCTTCLGTLTHDSQLYMPLGTYKRHGSSIPQRGGKALVLFVSALFDGPSASERWALVKALSQFGTFSGVVPSTSNQAVHGQKPVTVPTFNLVHAQYSSRYVVFDHRDVEDFWANILQKLSKADTKMVARFQFIPILIVGNYYLSKPMVEPEEYVSDSNAAFGFAQLRYALAHNYGGLDLLGQLVSDINAEANILTALICHADGGKPSTVCQAHTVKTLLKHVK
jgi:hypothetical protein